MEHDKQALYVVSIVAIIGLIALISLTNTGTITGQAMGNFRDQTPEGFEEDALTQYEYECEVFDYDDVEDKINDIASNVLNEQEIHEKIIEAFRHSDESKRLLNIDYATDYLLSELLYYAQMYAEDAPNIYPANSLVDFIDSIDASPENMDDIEYDLSLADTDFTISNNGIDYELIDNFNELESAYRSAFLTLELLGESDFEIIYDLEFEGEHDGIYFIEGEGTITLSIYGPTNSKKYFIETNEISSRNKEYLEDKDFLQDNCGFSSYVTIHIDLDELNFKEGDRIWHELVELMEDAGISSSYGTNLDSDEAFDFSESKISNIKELNEVKDELNNLLYEAFSELASETFFLASDRDPHVKQIDSDSNDITICVEELEMGIEQQDTPLYWQDTTPGAQT